VPRVKYAMDSRPKNSFSMSYTSHKVNFPGVFHTKTRTVVIGRILPPKSRYFNLTTLAQIEYLSSDRIVI